MLRIVMDGSGDMPDGWAEKYHLDILPMPIHIGSTTYYQGEDLTPTLFYKLIAESDDFPQTAAPSPERVRLFLDQINIAGDPILAITVSEKLSATYAMVRTATQALKEKVRTVVFDSGAGSAVLAILAREARLRDEAGETLDAIVEHLKKMREQTAIVLTVDSLEFARRSGRVNALTAAVSSLLKIKPIIALKDGALEMAEMVRTRQKSLERLINRIQDRFGSQPLTVAVVHAQDEPTAAALQTMVRSTLNCVELIVTELSISVAANLGPKTVGIVAIPSDL